MSGSPLNLIYSALLQSNKLLGCKELALAAGVQKVQIRAALYTLKKHGLAVSVVRNRWKAVRPEWRPPRDGCRGPTICDGDDIPFREDCPCYSECLRHVAKCDWPGWTCDGCKDSGEAQ